MRRFAPLTGSKLFPALSLGRIDKWSHQLGDLSVLGVLGGNKCFQIDSRVGTVSGCNSIGLALVEINFGDLGAFRALSRADAQKLPRLQIVDAGAP